MRVDNNPPAIDAQRRASNTGAAEAAERPAPKRARRAERAASPEEPKSVRQTSGSQTGSGASIKTMDEARETAARAKSSILSEISLARLVQANVTPQIALMLLQ
ncbi:MAG: hypothetical protein ABFC62_02765 [Clostridiaceae bacterium]|nr:hypothetical protein [Eubacteriales bacterium]